jgi:mRNA-degrading endonuclease RelE of RelBE toxin-antitoxin system
MSYQLRPVQRVEDELARLLKRDKVVYKQILKKLEKIAENPYTSGKWMHGGYAGIREIHLLHGRFVLMFKIDEKAQVVSLVNLEPHPEKY